ncbi:MAG: GerMN domain-containing protein [Bacillota bacterium]
MKRIQPYYWLLGLALVFILAGLAIYGLRLFDLVSESGMPVEPQVLNSDNSLFDLWFTGAEIYDLSVDRNTTGILFSASNNKVSLLDRDRRLRWEKNFTTQPLQAKLSSCGGYLAVGTAGGSLFFMSADQQIMWENQQTEAVYRVAVSANGNWVAAGRGNMEENAHFLDLYSQDGELKWSKSTLPLLKLFLAGEQADQGQVFYSQQLNDSAVTGAYSLENGDPLWSHEGDVLAAISRMGSRLAAIDGKKLRIYNYLGELLWESELPNTIEKVVFNPQNYNVLLYGTSDGAGENFFYYKADGELLWKMRIADGSLFSFTADGRHIVTSSWRHYKEDYTQMVLIDESGSEINSWEVAMRVEFLVVSNNRRYIVVGGEDGYIDIVDLQAHFAQEEERISLRGPDYSPLITEPGADSKRITLYFIGESENLIPVSRNVGLTENTIRLAIEELIRGPARDSSLFRTFPKEALVDLRFFEDQGRLVLDISPEVATMAGSAQTWAALESLRYTIGSFPQIREFYITVNNQIIEVFGDGLIVEQPLRPGRWQKPLFLPVLAGDRYYLVPREVQDLKAEDKDLDGLLHLAIRNLRTFYFVPGDLRLLGVETNSGTVTLNLNESVRVLFPVNGGEEERMHAALLLDALILTAYENSSAHKIEILVEGEAWSPPEGYPALSRTFYGFYFINPEP